MRPLRQLLRTLLLPSLLVPGCAALKGGGGTAPFPGADAVQKRIKEIVDKSTIAGDCLKKAPDPAAEKGGSLEVVAAADGKLTARPFIWHGSPQVQQCIVDAANKTTITPLAGPPVGTIWTFTAPGAAPAAAPTEADPKLSGLITDEQSRIQAELEGSCAQRYLPPEQPIDLVLTFQIMPGGKPAAVNIGDSTAKDGDFEVCAQQLMSSKTLPDPHYEGPYPARMHFHFGRLTNQL